MEGLSIRGAEELAERCIDACNEVLTGGGTSALEDLLAPDVVVAISEQTTEVLTGPADLAERLAPSAHRGGLVLLDVTPDGDDVVAGVAWADDPATRAAEVRVVPRGERIGRIEWVQ